MSPRKHHNQPATPSGFVRSFTADSWWNTPIPASVPVDPNSAAMTTAQASSCPPPTIGSPSGAWAMPWSEVGAVPNVWTTIRDAKGASVAVHVDSHIGAMAGDDAAVVWRDLTGDVEVSTFETVIPRKADGTIDTTQPITCKAFGQFGLLTNGIAKQAGGPSFNTGHRGIPPSAMALHPKDTAIKHRLKCSLGQPADSPGPNWPMYGIESPRSGAIPEGAVLRLKSAWADSTNPVQRAARDYGVIVGDTAGAGKATIKTVQGGTYPDAILKALDGLDWSDWEVMEVGWR